MRVEALEHQIDVAGDQIVDRRRAAAIRHVLDLRAGHELEQLAADMAGRAVARRRVGELAGIGLGLGDQFLHRLDVGLRRHREHQMPVRDQRDRLEVLLDVVGQLRHHVAGDRQRADRPDRRACSRPAPTWRRCPCRGERAARLVLDDDGLRRQAPARARRRGCAPPCRSRCRRPAARSGGSAGRDIRRAPRPAAPTTAQQTSTSPTSASADFMRHPPGIVVAAQH